MQVDRANLEEVLPDILKHIELADFISFDCEFTGLVTNLDRIEGLFSNHIQFYERIKETAYNFRIIQLGLAAFVFKEGTYFPHVYNIFIAPTTFAPGFNNVMVCQVESMQFLARNKLDFNRVICKGIKSRRLYSSDHEAKHRYNQFAAYSWDNMFLSPEEEENAALIESKTIQEIMNNPKLQRIVDFKNRTLFTYIRLKYPNMLFDKAKKNLKQFEYSIRFKPQSGKEQEPQIAQEKAQRPQEEVAKTEPEKTTESSCDLSKVFSALLAAKKPMVGHFPNLDIGLIYQTFVADLPETYEAFCTNLNQIFPYLLDTKVISRRIQPKLKGIKVDLSSLFKACQNPKLLKPYSNFDMQGLEGYVEKEHEAGYDAFITGCSFIGMANFLRGERGRVNFNLFQAENMLLYSRSSGEVSLSGNGYCSNASNYHNLIVILPGPLTQHAHWRQVAKALSKFGSLSVHEDHEQVYFVYEEPRDVMQIIGAFPQWGLKRYQQRRIIRARNMYNQAYFATS